MLLTVAALASGCHALASYRSSAADAAARTDGQARADAARDSAFVDAAPSTEAGRPPDGTPAPDLPPPTCVADTPALDTTHATCQCATGADDCDGLEGLADPQPSACNKLLFEARFSPAEAASWQGDGGWRVRCGRIEQTETTARLAASSYSWAWTTAPQPPTARTVVEARVELGKILDPDEWSVTLLARVVPGPPGSALPDAFIACSVRVDRVNRHDLFNGQRVPIAEVDGKVEMRSSQSNLGWEGAWPTDNPRWLSGTVVRMVMWYDDSNPTQRRLRCRILDEASGKGREAGFYIYTAGPLPNPYDGLLPKAAGAVGVRSRNRQARFDYIRVYSFGP